jgi:Trk K+ transport system NAD-binding subunit
MLDGQRYVITSATRLAVRVAQLLSDRGAEVVVVAGPNDALVTLLPDSVKVTEGDGSWRQRLLDADLTRCDCLLALSEVDLDNLLVTTAAGELAPDVPVVLRAFDAQLAEQLEAGLNVRRCFSASALAAPAFVAAAVGEEVLETMRIADAEVPLCRLHVRPASFLSGLSPREMKLESGCAAVARRSPGGPWEPARGDAGVLRDDDEIIVGGLLLDVVRLALTSSPLPAPRRRWRMRGTRHRTLRERLGSTLVPAAVIGLASLLLLTMAVFWVALDLGPVDAIYTALTNAFGDVGLSRESSAVKVFGVTVMIVGAVLIGVLLTHLTALFTANRLEEQAGRRAGRMRGHVVIAGLGMVGFRVERLLDELRVPSVIVERSSDNRFKEAAAYLAPVLSGDVRLRENLERAGIGEASCIIACTDDDVTNIAACVQARRLNPSIRTVARVFDDELADRLGGFGIDASLSMSNAAAGAFVGAATDERAVRRITIEGFELVALRHDIDRIVTQDEVVAWREQGLRILAAAAPGAAPGPATSVTDGLQPGAVAVFAGPEDVLRQCLFE